MLDSLVRVSRRVGGAADLLATEMRAVPVRHSLYEPTLLPAGRRARKNRGSRDKAHELHPEPQSAPSSSSREGLEKCSHRRPPSPRRVLADRRREGGTDASLNLQPRLRERLRLPLHSFTYS